MQINFERDVFEVDEIREFSLRKIYDAKVLHRIAINLGAIFFKFMGNFFLFATFLRIFANLHSIQLEMVGRICMLY